MKYKIIFIVFQTLFGFYQVQSNMFDRTTSTPGKKILFEQYLDSINYIESYQICINQESFSKDTINIKINDSLNITFILQDTIIEKFDMLCLSYLVKETKSKVILYSFENFKRISLAFFLMKVYTIK